MAFPTVVSVTTGADTAAGTSHTVGLPTVTTGQRLVAIIGGANNSVTWPAEWTEIFDFEGGGGGLANLAVAYHDYDGTEGASISVTSSDSAALSWAVLRISDQFSTAPEVSTGAGAPTASPSSTTLTPSWGSADTLWITAFSAARQPARTVSGYPTSYSGNQTYVASTEPTAAQGYLGLATRELAASSENPGSFKLSGTDDWAAVTIGIRPVVPAANFTASQTLAALTASATMTAASTFTASVTLEALTAVATYEKGAAYDATFERFKRARSEPYREFRQPGGRRR